jgi:Ca2+-binding RTX toxin-like protein
MPIKIFTSDDIGAGTRYSSSNGDWVTVNTGVVVAATGGAYALDGAGASNFLISGTVTGGLGGMSIQGGFEPGNVVHVTQTGSITGPIAMHVSGPQSTVLNDGYIGGGMAGLAMTGGSMVSQSILVNTGLIRGQMAVVRNLEGELEAFVLRNAGTLVGRDFAFFGGNSIDKVNNTGEIVGAVQLRDGDDIYRGAKGALDGLIDGGGGNDKIICGDDDDLIYGSNGHDRLAGGQGEDTFFFDFSINNIDKIRDFSIKDDTIALNAASFGLPLELTSEMLVSNKTGKAAEADDRIIYQSTTGNIYFDADGKGGESSRLFVSIDKGLKLSVDDFEMV